jgi:hypothetical protein
VGAVGRNTIGRAASNTNGAIGSRLADLNNTFAKLKTNENFLIRGVGNAGLKATTAIRTGSYDARSGLTKLGQNVLNATGSKNAKDFDLGKSAEGGYEKQLGDRIKKATGNIEKDIKAVKTDMVVSKKNISDAEKEIKIDGTDGLKVSRFNELMGNKDFVNQLMTNPAGINLSGNGLSKKDLEFLTGAAKGDSEILNKIDAAREKVNKKAGELKDKDAKVVQEEIKKQIKRSIQPDANFIERNLLRTGSGYGELLGDSVTGNRSNVRESVAQKFRESSVKETKEKSKERKKLADYIDNDIATSVRKTKELIEKAGKLVPTADFEKEIEELDKFINNQIKYTGDLSKSDGIDEFNKTLDSLFDAKATALRKVTQIAFDNKNTKLATDSSGLAKKTRTLKESYEKAKPKEEKHDEKKDDKK